MNAIKPYHKHSRSAKRLLKSLKDKGLPIELWKPSKKYSTVINWGSRNPINNADYIINQTNKVKYSSNKLYTFAKLLESGINVPRVTTNRDKAKMFDRRVYGRSNNLSSGKGIVIYENPNNIGVHDFYTEAVSHVRELRVHISTLELGGLGGMNGLISWSEKKPRIETPNKFIRNHSKGYYFSLRDNDRIPKRLLSKCLTALKSLGLDFCSFDILETAHGEHVFLESNTASGVEGTTLERYANLFGSIL